MGRRGDSEIGDKRILECGIRNAEGNGTTAEEDNS